MRDDTGNWFITDIESREASAYLLDDGQVISSSKISTPAPEQSLFEPGEDKHTRLSPRCLSPYYQIGQKRPVGVVAILEMFKERLEEAHGRKRRNK